MLGMVFRGFTDLVEDRFGLATLDAILQETDPASGGAYTAVGTYHHEEMVALVAALSRTANIPVADLLRTYGEALFGSLANSHGAIIAGYPNALDLLADLERTIHVEVRKLYSNAELPSFAIHREADALVLDYRLLPALCRSRPWPAAWLRRLLWRADRDYIHALAARRWQCRPFRLDPGCA